MKKLLFGLLAIGSISSYAHVNWKCNATDENGRSYSGLVEVDISTAKETAISNCESKDGLSYSDCSSYDSDCSSSGKVICEATDRYGYIYTGIGASTRIAQNESLSNCESSSRGCEEPSRSQCDLY